MSNRSEYDSAYLIDCLQKVANELGKSPSRREYLENKDVDMPTSGTFETNFGSWNEAKEAAGLEKHHPEGQGRPPSGCPENIDISQEEWEGLERNKRYRLRKKSRIYEIKSNSECKKCGFSGHPASLDFHHPDENKSGNVAELVGSDS
jgi:hypothetical protein